MKRLNTLLAGIIFLLLTLAFNVSNSADDPAEKKNDLFKDQVAPIIERSCLECHNSNDPQGGLSLETKEAAFKGGDSGEAIIAGKLDESFLIDYVTGPEPEMPKKGTPLTKEEIEILSKWIQQGAQWPDKLVLVEPQLKQSDWWSFQSLKNPALPEVSASHQSKVRNVIDQFLLKRLEQDGLTYSPEADRQTLIRRLYFDLIGLPPTPEEVREFVEDEDENAYEKLVDQLLASKRYGERWARHWLDIVHYADTHGYDKDKLRNNAWPYRDYVIRSFNEDKKYSDFVMEQLAGDVLDPFDPTGIAATGFIVTGPFDWVGQIEVGEDLIEKKITRNLDRDDMVSVTMNTFQSVTVQCARCHNHKFDPITQEDYYKQQTVFAAIDRAEKMYDPDPETARKRSGWNEQKEKLAQARTELLDNLNQRTEGKLAQLEKEIETLNSGKMKQGLAFGYHSQIAATDDVLKWVQLDLDEVTSVKEVVIIPAYDDYNNIGKGFGFPVRFRVEVSNDPEFKQDVELILDHQEKDFKNPGSNPVTVSLNREPFRYVRITATKLAPRSNDFIFALGEIQVIHPEGTNLAQKATVTSLDSIEAGVRWGRKNLVDGEYYSFETDGTKERLSNLKRERKTLFQKTASEEEKKKLKQFDKNIEELTSRLESLPSQKPIFTASTDFQSRGNFKPTKGEPRPVFLLHRGNEGQPIKEVEPGGLRLVSAVPPEFKLNPDHEEGERRLALAKWIVHKDNALTWRSIVNRIWQFHFGQGIVNTPNDFGKMGALPSHPELLDYLAIHFRDQGQSFKDLHRLILLSTAYRQVSEHNEKAAAIDGGNQLLWRMNRRKLDAEALRDSVLQVSGKLNLKMFGPGYHLFQIEKPEHSPHYLYDKHDPNDEETLRRTIYRFVVRSVPDPFMDSLDCANPSQTVPKRMQTLTALQALSLLNDKFMIAMSVHFAERLKEEEKTTEGRINKACQLAFGRTPSAEEQDLLVSVANEHGLENACRLLFNTNEFMFVD